MRVLVALLALAVGGLTVGVEDASAQLSVDRVIVDFAPGEPRRQDILVSNTSDEVAYVQVEPRVIQNPGKPDQESVTVADPRERGLLVSPERLKLPAGARQRVRFALLDRPSDQDRIYRVSIRPVVGDLESQETAVKVLVGYDVLVMARPQNADPNLTTRRADGQLMVRNSGNTNALLFRGEQCAPGGGDCVDLPSKRIYAGADWSTELPYDTPVEYRVKIAGEMARQTF
jgi:P pilus assembly chaperone PapD